MVTQELVNYIKQSLILYKPEETIIKTLLQQGWPESDIKSGLFLVKNQNKKINSAKSSIKNGPNKKINPKIIIAATIASIIVVGILTGVILKNINKSKKQQQEIILIDQQVAVKNGQQSSAAYNPSTNSAASNAQNQSAQQKYDEAVKGNMPGVLSSINGYYAKNKTYKDYSLDVEILGNLGKICDTKIKIDISPDGTAYAIHRNLCENPLKSFCIENGVDGVLISETSLVEKTYHCK